MIKPHAERTVAAGKPGKSGGYDEPKPDKKRGDDAEDAFVPDYEQGRDTVHERDDDASTKKPSDPKRPAG